MTKKIDWFGLAVTICHGPRYAQKIEEAKLEGRPGPMSAYDVAMRGGDPDFERRIAKMEAMRDQEEEDE